MSLHELFKLLEPLGWNPLFTREWMMRTTDRPEAASWVPGRIFSDHGSEYLVRLADRTCRASLLGKQRIPLDALERPTVGDWVLIEPIADDRVRIRELLPRSTMLARRAVGGTSNGQAIAANVDLALIVNALSPPESGRHALERSLNPRRTERYLTAARAAELQPILVVNKADVHPEAEELVARFSERFGRVDCLLVSAERGTHIAELAARVRTGQTAVFVGSSGVGKSSLINCLLGNGIQRTSSERIDDSRGRHTTTSRQLFLLPTGGLLMDTPGMRELGLWADENTDTSSTGNRDLDALGERCKFPDCQHVSEPGCAVLAAIEQGTFSEELLHHARKLQRELEWQKERHDAFARHQARQRHRAFSKHARQVQERKRRT